MSGQSLRMKYMRNFSGLERYSVAFARLVVASYIVQILASIAVGHFVLLQPVTPLTVLAVCALGLFTATRFRGLNNIVHECSHATFVKDRPENVLLGSICASIVLSCYKDYRDEHLTHHQHLGDYEHDLDLQGIEDLKLHEPLSARTVLRHVITPLIGRHLPYYLGANLSARDGQGFLWFKYALIAATGVLALVAPWTALFTVIVPFVWVYSAINYWTDCLDHAGLVSSEDELDSSRNILAPMPLRVLFFPRHDCFHLVHHLFPQIPARHLSDCHRILEQDEVYKAKPNATPLRARVAKTHPIGAVSESMATVTTD